MLLIETSMVVLAILVAFIYPTLGSGWFDALERHLSRLARRRVLSVLLVGVTPLVLRAAILPIEPIPVPVVHDEFSYLLMADTFAHGRLTNPTHPMWMHFETFHEIQKPTYASMYYPAQGAFLALGQVVFGHPFWGVWLTAGLMCATICWALQGWVPPFWALLGSLLAVIRIGTVSYWANSYWGGAVAAIGGSLVLGALPRIKRHRRLRDALLMGAGFTLLANSRPYESIFFSIPVFVWMLSWARGPSAPSLRMLATRVAMPLGLIGMITIVATGYYFWRLTGSPFRTPFFINLATYNPVPYFPWQSIRPIPVYHHAVMEKFYLGWWAAIYRLGRHQPLTSLLLKSWALAAFFFGPILSAILFASTFTIPYGTSFGSFSGRTQFMLILCASVLFGAALPVYFNPHYVAAITSAVYVLILAAMQRLRRWEPLGRPTGLAIVRWMFATAVLMLAVLAAASELGVDASTQQPTWFSPFVYRTWRAEIGKQLLATRQNHLVIVRYNPNHSPLDEWVFNQADIDGSRIVWARDMGNEEANEELIRYFKDRKVWTINPDQLPPVLSPYQPPSVAKKGQMP